MLQWLTNPEIIKNDNSAFTKNNSSFEIGVWLYTGDPRPSDGQTHRRMFPSAWLISVSMSFTSLRSERKSLHPNSHDSCFTLISCCSRWWRCQGAAENCHVYYTSSAHSSSSVPAGSGSPGSRCQSGYLKHVVSWLCSCLALHTLAFDCKKRVCIDRSTCWTNVSNLFQWNLSTASVTVGTVSTARQPGPVLPLCS